MSEQSETLDPETIELENVVGFLSDRRKILSGQLTSLETKASKLRKEISLIDQFTAGSEKINRTTSRSEKEDARRGKIHRACSNAIMSFGPQTTEDLITISRRKRKEVLKVLSGPFFEVKEDGRWDLTPEEKNKLGEK